MMDPSVCEFGSFKIEERDNDSPIGFQEKDDDDDGSNWKIIEWFFKSTKLSVQMNV